MATNNYNSLGIPVAPSVAAIGKPIYSTTPTTAAAPVPTGANFIIKSNLGTPVDNGAYVSALPSGNSSPAAVGAFDQSGNGTSSSSVSVDGLNVKYTAGVGSTPTGSFTVSNPASIGQAFIPNTANNATIGANSRASSEDTTQNLFTASNNSFLNNYTVTKKDIKDLEKQTNLSLLPWPFGELCYIKHCFSNLNSNTYYLLLSMLVYGFDYKVLTSKIVPEHDKAVIDLNFINDFKLMANDPVISKFIRKTPAYAKGCFDNVGCFGVTHAVNGANQSSSPISGPTSNQSSLVTSLINKIHPNATQELESFCNKIRTHAWLSLPKGSFGSLSSIISKINGVITAFQTIISDVYQGCIQLVQKMYAVVNGIINKAQKALLDLVNKIIPLDLLCLILATLQTLLDDVNFFTSLFQMSGPFLNYLNTFQNYLTSASQLVSNPFATIQSYMPPQVNNIINMVNQIGADPNGYLADHLNNYGYGYVLNALQGNLMGAIVNKYGPQYASITPLGNALTQATAVYSRFGGQFPSMPATMGPNIYTGNESKTKTDVNGNPIDNIQNVLMSDYNQFTASLSNLFSGQSSETKTNK